MANLVQEGVNLDYTPSSAVSAGDVVLFNSEMIGVCVTDIAANELGAVAVQGVYEFTTADTFDQGEAAYWNAVGSVMTDDTTDVYAGRVTKTVAAGTKVNVAINFMCAPAGS